MIAGRTITGTCPSGCLPARTCRCGSTVLLATFGPAGRQPPHARTYPPPPPAPPPTPRPHCHHTPSHLTIPPNLHLLAHAVVNLAWAGRTFGLTRQRLWTFCCNTYTRYTTTSLLVPVLHFGTVPPYTHHHAPLPAPTHTICTVNTLRPAVVPYLRAPARCHRHGREHGRCRRCRAQLTHPTFATATIGGTPYVYPPAFHTTAAHGWPHPHPSHPHPPHPTAPHPSTCSPTAH